MRSWWRYLFWLGLLSSARCRSGLFPVRTVDKQVSSRRSEAPIFTMSSVEGNHELIGSLYDGQYVSTSGIGHHDSVIEWVWQRPLLSGRGHTIRGIVLLAHGCSHHAMDFFPRSPSCPKCIGLPEELRMSNGLLRQQYAVVAISSAGHCWGEEDFPRVQKVLGIISSELGAGLPRYAVGASSGGSFVAHLPNFVIQIMSVPGKTLLHGDGGRNAYPPSLWIVMEKDARTLRSVQRSVKYLNMHNKTAELLEAKALPMNDNFFSDRIIQVSPKLSMAIVQALSRCNLLDSGNHLIEDPRNSAWRSCLKEDKALWDDISNIDSLEADKSPISEELNVAYAVHELTGNHMSDIINFIMKYK